MQRCRACRNYVHPPYPECTNCRSGDLSFEPVSGRGVIFERSIVESPVVIGFEDEVPYACLLVELVEQAGLLVAGNLVDAPPEEARIGRPVEVVFRQEPDGFTLPMFTLVSETFRHEFREQLRNQVAIVGVGYSDVKRHSERHPGPPRRECLHQGARRRRPPSRGHRRRQQLPHSVGAHRRAPSSTAIHIVGVDYLSQAMHLDNLVWSCSITGGTISAALVEAVHALAAGACNYVLVWRAMHNP